MAQGVGVFRFATGGGGDAYHKGHFVNDVRHGRGVERTRDGSLYVGEWKRGRHDGWGVFTKSKGDTYRGYWLDGRKLGECVYHFHNGDVYDGDFINDKAKG